VFSAVLTTALVNGDSITVTHPSVVSKAVTAFDFAGLLNPVVDRTATATGNSTTPSSGATATTLSAEELLIGATGAEARITSDATYTPNASFITNAAWYASADTTTSNTSITMYPSYQIVGDRGLYRERHAQQRHRPQLGRGHRDVSRSAADSHADDDRDTDADRHGDRHLRRRRRPRP
jgi:hypothetical protein